MSVIHGLDLDNRSVDWVVRFVYFWIEVYLTNSVNKGPAEQ
jgi:hypothetical protein